jgi:hypothetical protein
VATLGLKSPAVVLLVAMDNLAPRRLAVSAPV